MLSVTALAIQEKDEIIDLLNTSTSKISLQLEHDSLSNMIGKGLLESMLTGLNLAN
jgi:hypothetical protein